MNKLKIKPAFRYCVTGAGKSWLMFTGAIIVVYLITIISSMVLVKSGAEVFNSTTIYEFAGMIFIFVTGIVSVREDTRLLMQHGIGRRTSFITCILVASTISLVMAVFGELLISLARLATAGYDNIVFGSIYQITFDAAATGFTSHLLSIVVLFFGYLFSYLLGMMISLIFYRLPKIWKIVVAVGVPVLLVIVLPLSTNLGFAPLLQPLFNLVGVIVQFTFSSVGAFVLVTAICCLIIGILNKLLLRRAPIIHAA